MRTRPRFLLAAVLVALLVLAALALRFGLSQSRSLPRQLELGEKYLTELDYENAVIAFTAAIEIDDRSEDAYWGRGRAYAGLQRHEEAIQDFTVILDDLNPESIDAYLARGDEYAATGQTDNARADYEAAQQLDPDSPDPAGRLDALPPETVTGDSLVWSVPPQSGFEVVGMVYFEGQGPAAQITEGGRSVLADAVGNGSTVIPDGRYAAIQNGRYGLLDLQGNWVAPPEYLSITSSYVEESYDWTHPELVYSLNRYGTVDAYTDPETGYYLTDTFDDTGALVPKTNNPSYNGASLWFTWDSSAGAPLLVDRMDWSYTIAPDLDFSRPIGVCPASTPGQGMQALYRSGSLLSDFIYEDVRDFSDGLIAVRQNGKWGYADETGSLVIPCEYEAIRTDNLSDDATMEEQDARGHAFAASCTEGYVVVSDGSRYALYDTQGNPVIDFGVLEVLTEVHNGKLWARRDGQWGVLDLDATLAA